MRKILHIITRLDRGGSSEDLGHFCHHLKSRFAQTIVYGRSDAADPRLIERLSSDGIVLRPLACLKRSINPLADIPAYRALQRMIGEENPDIIHTHTSKAGILGRLAGWQHKQMNNPQLRLIHSTYGHVFYGYYPSLVSNLFVRIERAVAPAADAVVALSGVEIEEHLQRGIGSREQFRIVPSGIDLSPVHPAGNIRERLGIADDAFVVGSVGRLEPVKGFRYFVEAIRRLEARRGDPRRVYLIVGDGSERSSLEKRARAGNLGGRVIFTGWQEDVSSCIEAMDIYVQPSLNEGMGKTVLTAQFLGKPVVASRVQGIASLIEHERSGLLVAPALPGELADAILRCASDADLRGILASRGASAVRAKDTATGLDRFSIANMTVLMERIYDQLLPS